MKPARVKQAAAAVVVVVSAVDVAAAAVVAAADTVADAVETVVIAATVATAVVIAGKPRLQTLFLRPVFPSRKAGFFVDGTGDSLQRLRPFGKSLRKITAESFTPMDLLFYAIGIFEGFKFGSRLH